MFGSGILDAVIGLMFVFLLVSLLVTIVSEMIAARRMWRAKILREGIGRLLGTTLGAQFYAHPLISGSGRHEEAMRAGTDGPSYIPSRSFANVVMRLVEANSAGLAAVKVSLHRVLDLAAANGASVETLMAELSTVAARLRADGGIGAAAAEILQRRLDAPPASNTRAWLTEVQTRVHELDRAAQPSYTALLTALTSLVDKGINGQLSVQQLRMDFDNAVATLLTGPTTQVLRDELTAMGQRLQGPYTAGDAIADFRWFTNALAAPCLRHLLEEVADPHTREIFLTLFDDAGHDLEKFKENVEVWFNNGMDRVNGWYKRHTQAWACALAVITVVTLNVDAVAIFHHLQTDQGARDALAAKAGAYVAAQKAATSANRQSPRSVTSGVALAFAFKDEKLWTLDYLLAPSLDDQFEGIRNELSALSLPIGWVSSKRPTADEMKKGLVVPASQEDVGTLLAGHWLGWLITALAATLGAPFWFDMLNRIISVRATGRPPEEDPKAPKSVSKPVEPGQTHQEADRLSHERR